MLRPAPLPPEPRATELDLAAKVRLLSDPHTYPGRPRRVEAIETHKSWVFLTERFAYKLKKPFRNTVVDLSTLAAREANCWDEVRLNRRLAPDVYLGVQPLTIQEGQAALGGAGEPVEWLVCMRRLPAERMFDRMLRDGRAGPDDARAIATTMARFYTGRLPEPLTGGQYRQSLAAELAITERDLGAVQDRLPAGLAARVIACQKKILRREAELFDRRVTEGRVVEGHGDLRPQHICLEDPPVVFDCLELNRQLRVIDPADELAFLALECERLGAPWVRPVLLDAYRRASCDVVPPRLTDFYTSYRAAMWARLATWRIRDLPPKQHGKWLERAAAYLRLAEAHAPRL